MGDRQNVGIIFWEGHLDTSPSIINLIRLLLKNNFQVTCFLKANLHSKALDFKDEQYLRLVEFPDVFSVKKIFHINQSKDKIGNEVIGNEVKGKSSNNITKRIKTELKIVLQYLNFILHGYRIFKDNNWNYFFCIDGRSLVLGYFIKLFVSRNIPIIYYSLEIITESEYPSYVNKFIKKLERRINRKSVLTITQDIYRLKYLEQINNIQFNKNNHAIIPNGIIGFSEVAANNYFNDKFNLNESDVIILAAGGFARWNQVREIAKSSFTWNTNLKLIFHVTKKPTSEDILLREVMENSGGKAFISDEFVPFYDLPKIIKSADIGLALYDKNRGGNIFNIVGASGKMILYLYSGLPVIAFEYFPGFKELFSKYPVGVLINNEFEIEAAVGDIMKQYEYYSLNCIECFKNEFEYEKSFDQMLLKLVSQNQ
jgi:hypothetical protein